ncbi:hypothetical protein QYF61_010790 [Mycteria americana]|uniref:Uncharacterized protein n=1 Tax=Mycteria americana TaxID=33587 RepID=A0AAN7NXN7_MYCAM|nr:hypothetical protein QYF61_010790 [Mycteria americana]
MVPGKPRLTQSWDMQGMSGQQDELPLLEWLMSLQSCCSSSSQGHEDQGRSSVTGERQMLHPPSKKRVAGLTKGKSGLANLLASHDEMDGFVGKGRAVGTIYLSFSEAFNTMSHKVLASK